MPPPAQTTFGQTAPRPGCQRTARPRTRSCIGPLNDPGEWRWMPSIADIAHDGIDGALTKATARLCTQAHLDERAAPAVCGGGGGHRWAGQGPAQGHHEGKGLEFWLACPADSLMCCVVVWVSGEPYNNGHNLVFPPSIVPRHHAGNGCLGTDAGERGQSPSGSVQGMAGGLMEEPHDAHGCCVSPFHGWQDLSGPS